MVSKILQCCLLKDSVFRELKQQWRRRLWKRHLKSEVALPQTLSRCRPRRRCLLFDVMWPSLRVQPSFLSPFHLGCFTERTSVPQWQCYTDNVNQCLDNLVIMGFQININVFSVISECEFPCERAEAKLKRIINSTIKLWTVLQYIYNIYRICIWPLSSSIMRKQ